MDASIPAKSWALTFEEEEENDDDDDNGDEPSEQHRERLLYPSWSSTLLLLMMIAANRIGRGRELSSHTGEGGGCMGCNLSGLV